MTTTIKLKLHLFLERNNNVPVQNSAYDNVENGVLPDFDENYEHLGDNEYLLTAHYTDNDDLDKQMEELLTNLEDKAENRDCHIADTYIHATDDKSRRWE